MTALHSSATHLRVLVGDLSPAQFELSAYPTDWTVADVLSHLGSAAVIQRQRLADTLAGVASSDDFAPSVWDVWNAKDPASQVADSLAADQELLDGLDAVPDDIKGDLSFLFGPLTIDFDQFVAFRLNEHALHTWDVAVAVDPAATLWPDATDQVIDNLEIITRFAGKPTGEIASVDVHTVDPGRDFRLSLDTEGVALAPQAAVAAPDLELPAEALIRLVYGRLDADHTPAIHGDAPLELLRRTFPGL